MKVAGKLAWTCAFGAALVFSIGCAGAPEASTTEMASGVSQRADDGSGVEADADYRASKGVVDAEAARLRAVRCGAREAQTHQARAELGRAAQRADAEAAARRLLGLLRRKTRIH